MAGNIATIQTLEQLETFAGQQRTLFVTDLTSGGLFQFTTEELTPDNVNVIRNNALDGYWVRDRKDDNFSFNNAYIAFGSEPIIAPTVGEDELIRETGNKIYDPNTNQYIIVYSGSLNPYTGDNVYIYYATSPTGKAGTWTKQGKLVETTNEDPYLEIIGDQYRLYAEKKSAGNINDGIELFTGTELTDLVSQGLILVGDVGEWDEQDDSSPTPYFKDGVHYLFFEGRSNSGQDGAVGVATSIDGLTYTKNPNNPIIKGSQSGNTTWFSHVVPDDIIEYNNKFYMSTHVYNGTTYVTGIFDADSIDSEVWRETLNTWLSIDGTVDDKGALMLYKDAGNSIYGYNGDSDNTKGIYESILNIRATDRLWYSSKISSTVSATTALSASGRNQIIHAPIVSNKVFELRSDLSSHSGLYKLIHNDSNFILYIDPQTGVTINGSTSNLVIPSGRKAYMYLDDVDTWIAFILPSDTDITNWDNVYNNRNNYLRSQSDGTAGSYMGTSTFTNANDLKTGFAYFSGTATNLPDGTASHIVSFSRDVNYGGQIAFRNNSFWYRGLEAGTYGSWLKMATETFVNAKVQNSLTASTTIAPSATAVNTALALKADLTSQIGTNPGVSTQLTSTDTYAGAIWRLQNQVNAITDANLSKTADYTVLTTDFGKNGHVTIFVDANSAAVQITLPAVNLMIGKTVNIIKTDATANAVTVKGNGSTNINGNNTYVISTLYDNTSVKSNGTQYYIFA